MNKERLEFNARWEEVMEQAKEKLDGNYPAMVGYLAAAVVHLEMQLKEEKREAAA